MTTVWEDEYRSFRKRNFGDKDFVYVWADGVHFNVRLEDDRLCTLVIIGVRQDGTKELVTVEDGVRKAGLRCCATSKRAACEHPFWLWATGLWDFGAPCVTCGRRRKSSVIGFINSAI